MLVAIKDWENVVKLYRIKKNQAGSQVSVSLAL